MRIKSVSAIGAYLKKNLKWKKAIFCPKCEDYREFETKKELTKFYINDREIFVLSDCKRCVVCGEKVVTEKEEEERKMIESILIIKKDKNWTT
jgi:uncharacterized Zn finger protein (UPF0148 family)